MRSTYVHLCASLSLSLSKGVFSVRLRQAALPHSTPVSTAPAGHYTFRRCLTRSRPPDTEQPQQRVNIPEIMVVSGGMDNYVSCCVPDVPLAHLEDDLDFSKVVSQQSSVFYKLFLLQSSKQNAETEFACSSLHDL